MLTYSLAGCRCSRGAASQPSSACQRLDSTCQCSPAYGHTGRLVATYFPSQTWVVSWAWAEGATARLTLELRHSRAHFGHPTIDDAHMWHCFIYWLESWLLHYFSCPSAPSWPYCGVCLCWKAWGSNAVCQEPDCAPFPEWYFACFDWEIAAIY